MSHRTAHLVLAHELRLDRIEAGLPGDPSQRGRRPAARFTCSCGKVFRLPFQRRLHALLNACEGS